VLLVFAIWFAAVAWTYYPYWGDTGPGSGFLPVWLGVAMGILALLLLVGASRREGRDVPWLPEGEGLKKLVIVLAAVAVLVAALPVVGMISGTALFLVGVLRFLERYPWLHSVGIAAATTLANYLVFTYWLRVPFPVSILGF
jgi:hypothetical protein